MSFYRTYRPQLFFELDNIRVREQLVSFLQKEKRDLPHAFLFSGPRGGGKTTAARLVAKLFTCVKLSKKDGPCGQCEQCTSIEKGNNLDVLELDAASNRGIDEIRTLRDGIGLSPSAASHKIYIIDEVHMLTTEAFNALLKTLEEPPAHAVFILATTDPHKVPATILSRCMHIQFGRAGTEEIFHALKRIVDTEHVAIAPDAISEIARLADGSFRDAVKFLEQMSFTKDAMTVESVRTTLGVSTLQSVVTFLDVFARHDMKASLAIIASLVEAGIDLKTFLVSVLTKLEQILLAGATGEMIAPWTVEEVRVAIRRLSQAFVEMKGAAIPQLPLELAIVEWGEYRGASADSNAEKTSKIDISISPRSNPRSSAMPERKHEDVGITGDNSSGLVTLEKLTECWKDIIEAVKPFNHSISGVLRSTRPKSVSNGIVTIEAFYSFHRDKLNESKTKDILVEVFKKSFGEKVKVETVLGKK